jgi:hypothetical protein
VAFRSSDVPVFSSVTAAPLITALLASVTLPVTYPEVVDCARIVGTHASMKVARMAGQAYRVKRIFSFSCLLLVP